MKSHKEIIFITGLAMILMFDSSYCDNHIMFTPLKNPALKLYENNNVLRQMDFTKSHAQMLFKSDMVYGLREFDEPVVRIYRRKSPAAAFVLAFVPGFFVHGLGHFYIEDNKSGTGLLLVELASIGLLFGVFIFESSEPSYSPYPGGESYDDNFLTDVLTMTAVSMFLGSWIYDFIGAPVKAFQMNKEKEWSFYIYPEIKQEQISLNLAYSWK